MYSNAIRAYCAVIFIVCAAIAAACDSSPVDVAPSADGSARVVSLSGSSFPVSPLQVDFGDTATFKSIKITNNESGSLNWTSGESAGWLTMNQTWGTVGARTSETLRLKVDRTGRQPGTYKTNISFSSPTAGSGTVVVSMTVPSDFALTPDEVDLGTSATSAAIKLANEGNESLTWSANEGVSWLALGSTSGTLAAGAERQVTLNVNRTGITAGTYTTKVSFSTDEGSAELPVSMVVPSSESEPSPPPPPPSGATVNVRDFGAKGNGIADDSPAFERAIDALPATGGTVLVPAGTYLLKPMFLSPVRPLSLVEKDNIAVVGQGMDSTTLKMVNGQYPGSTFMILIMGSSGIEIRDLTFDMNRDGSWYGDEQSHIMRVESSQNVRFSRVRFANSPGDGIKFIGLGELGEEWVDGAWVENCKFFNMWRNGITIQRGVRNLQIRNNTFDRVSQQSISSEPTGFDGAATDILIEDNVINHFSGSYSIALSGGGSRDPIKRLTFRNNTVNNGAVFFLWIEGIQVTGNTLRGGLRKSTLRLQDVTGGVVANNSMVGTDERASAVFQLLNDGNALSRDVEIRDNLVDARVGRTGIQVKDPLSGILVSGNQVLGPGGARGIVVETLLAGLGKRSGITVRNNDIRNFKYSIAFVVRGDRFSNVRVESNRMSHDQQPAVKTVGIVLDRTGPISTFAVLLANVFGSGIQIPVQLLGS